MTLAPLLLAALMSGPIQVPEVLVVQLKTLPPTKEAEAPKLKLPKGIKNEVGKGEKEEGLPFDLSVYFAGELEGTGRMRPILWSNTDPVFRLSIEDGILKNPAEFPSLKEVQAFANKLKLSYVAFVGAERRGDVIVGYLQLAKKDKVVFENRQEMGAQVNGAFDTEGSARSVCRTWIEILAQGELKAYGIAPKTVTPDPSPGALTRPDPLPVPPPKPVVDNAQLLKAASDLVKRGAVAEAVILLRDAVDAEPLDAQRRTVFVTMLLRSGQAELAGLEARRATELLPDNVSLRALAARAWLAAKKPEEAQIDLNEAIARDPNNPETRLLLAETSMASGNFKAAKEHLDKVIEKAPSADAYFKRAVIATLEGNAAEASANLAKVDSDANGLELSTRYDLAVDFIDSAAKLETGNAVSLFQRALVKRTDPGTSESLSQITAKFDAYLNLVEKTPAPVIYVNSHERRLLALKLMKQCLGDVTAFLKSGDEDILTDARITLGEATRSLNLAREALAEERKKT
jgi:tetratricopeptide (TPR) repeat protein